MIRYDMKQFDSIWKYLMVPKLIGRRQHLYAIMPGLFFLFYAVWKQPESEIVTQAYANVCSTATTGKKATETLAHICFVRGLETRTR